MNLPEHYEIRERRPGTDHRLVFFKGRQVGFTALTDNFICLERCPDCGRENYCHAVMSGTCCWCGFSLNQPAAGSPTVSDCPEIPEDSHQDKSESQVVVETEVTDYSWNEEHRPVLSINSGKRMATLLVAGTYIHDFIGDSPDELKSQLEGLAEIFKIAANTIEVKND